jgi:hypothetical protein
MKMEDQSLDGTHKITSLSPFFFFETIALNKKNLIFLSLTS